MPFVAGWFTALCGSKPVLSATHKEVFTGLSIRMTTTFCLFNIFLSRKPKPYSSVLLGTLSQWAFERLAKYICSATVEEDVCVHQLSVAVTKHPEKYLL